MDNEGLLVLMQAYELSLKLPEYPNICAELRRRLREADTNIAKARAEADAPKAIPSTTATATETRRV